LHAFGGLETFVHMLLQECTFSFACMEFGGALLVLNLVQEQKIPSQDNIQTPLQTLQRKELWLRVIDDLLAAAANHPHLPLPLELSLTIPAIRRPPLLPTPITTTHNHNLLLQIRVSQQNKSPLYFVIHPLFCLMSLLIFSTHQHFMQCHQHQANGRLLGHLASAGSSPCIWWVPGML